MPFFTYESIFDLDVLPSSLAVIGGGPIGSELAQAMARLGSQVRGAAWRWLKGDFLRSHCKKRVDLYGFVDLEHHPTLVVND